MVALAPGPAEAQAAPLQSVIVTLRAQPDLSGIHGSPAARLREVVRRSQARAASAQRPLAARVRAWRRSGRVTRFTPLWVFDGFALTGTPAVIRALARSPAVASVRRDRTIGAPPSASLAVDGAPEWNVARINAPALWDLGLTGQGIVVASLDTGVDVTHPDLAASWRGGADSWYDPYGQHATPFDRSGHGTQVMGVMVAGDAGGTAVGVAPGARWIAARIFDDQGQGTVSAVHQAFQWLLDPDHDPLTADAPQVVNGSWEYGAGCNLEFAPDLDALRAAGIVPVFAAGNHPGIPTSPADNPGALAVGATTSADDIASFSSTGPSACGEPPTTFPEITAPGVSIHTTDLHEGYTTQEGTSLAAPHVTGALALLLGGVDGLTGAQAEHALEQAALDLGPPGADDTFGAGRLDVLAAYAVASAPDFALALAPGSADTMPGGAAAFTVTSTALRGFGDDVSLSISGLPEGAGATVAPAAIAGGAGTAELAIATTPGIPPGSYPFSVEGSSGELAHAAAGTLVVTDPVDFGLGLSPAALTLAPRQRGAVVVSVRRVGGFASAVTLSVSGVPAGVKASFSVNPVPVGKGSKLRLRATARAAVGAWTITVSGAADGRTRSAAETLTVG
jgi:subtilisin family serine protease